MFKWLALFLALATPAAAQNVTCATRGVGDNSNACASTAFVHNEPAHSLMTYQPGPSSGTSSSYYNYNHINIPSDNYALTGSAIGNALMIDYVFGGSNTKGPRDALTNFLVSIGSDPTDPSPFYTGVFSTVLAYNKAGPDGANITGYIANVVAKPASTVWNVIGFESNTFIETGGTSKIRNGINLVSRGNAHGYDFDAAVVIGAALSPEVAWKNGIYFTDQDVGYPIEPTGCLICTDGQVHTVAKGVDISSYNITGNAWKSPGAYITGAGVVGATNMEIGTPNLSTSFLQIFSGATSLYSLGKDASNQFIIRDNVNAVNTLTISNGVALRGTTAGGNASAGFVGEVVSLEVLSGSAVSLSNGVAANVDGGLSLTAGDWDCNGNVAFLPAAGTSTGAIEGWISTASATNPGAPNKGGYSSIALNTAAVGYSIGTLSVGPFRVNVSTTTTVYLGASSNFSGGTNAAYGYMACRRVR